MEAAVHSARVLSTAKIVVIVPGRITMQPSKALTVSKNMVGNFFDLNSKDALHRCHL